MLANIYEIKDIALSFAAISWFFKLHFDFGYCQ